MEIKETTPPNTKTFQLDVTEEELQLIHAVFGESNKTGTYAMYVKLNDVLRGR